MLEVRPELRGSLAREVATPQWAHWRRWRWLSAQSAPPTALAPPLTISLTRLTFFLSSCYQSQEAEEEEKSNENFYMAVVFILRNAKETHYFTIFLR